MEIIVEKTLAFQPHVEKLPALYSFDVFDTLISRKVLDPKGIFYCVQERMYESGKFSRSFVMRYPEVRESGVLPFVMSSASMEKRKIRLWMKFTLTIFLIG